MAEENEAVETILNKLEEEEAAGAPENQASAEEEVVQESNEQEREEQAEEPAIEPPPTWKAELKDKWSALPRDLQQSLAQWETERNQGFNSKLNESAEAKKAAEAERLVLAQERQRYAQQLDGLIQQATAIDPVLAQASKMNAADWERLWRDSPAEAGLFERQVNNRVAQIKAWQDERQRLSEDQLRTLQSKEDQKLSEKIPEWSDASRREQLSSGITKTLIDVYGFKPEEVGKVFDHRHVLVARDAMLYRQMMAAKETAQSKKVVSTQKVVKPGGAQDGKVESERVKALKQRALRSGKEDDAVAAVLAAIG